MRVESVTKIVIRQGERKLRGRYKLVKIERESYVSYITVGAREKVRAHISFLS